MDWHADWHFDTHEHLAMIVALIFDKKVFKDKATFDRLTEVGYPKGDLKETYDLLQQVPEAMELFHKALAAIGKKKLVCLDTPEQVAAQPEMARVRPLSFLQLAVRERIEIPYFLREAARKKLKDEAIKNYKKRRLTREEIFTLLKEPLWDLYTAILYLHGFKGCGNADWDKECVRGQKNLQKIYQYAEDSYKIKALHLYTENRRGELSSQVKPWDIIAWSRTLGMDFPCHSLIEPPAPIIQMPPPELEKVVPLQTPIEPPYTTPYIDLMRAAIDALGISASYQPPKKTIEQWLRKHAPELSDRFVGSMATLVRVPEMQKGGYWHPEKAKGDTQKKHKKTQ